MKKFSLVFLAIMLAFVSNGQAQTFPSGLVSWWKGDGNILDSVGTNNGTIDVPAVTLAFVPGVYGQAFEFSGGSVQIPDAADLKPLTNLTLQAWVRNTNLPGLGTYVVTKSESVGGATTASYGFEAVNNNLAFFIYDGTNRIQAPVVPQNTIWDGNWHMVTGTYDGTMVHLYLDGIEVGSGTVSTNSINYSNPAPLVFGADGTDGLNAYFGDLDEVKVFTNVMSANDVLNTYIDPNDPAATNGLVGWWKGEGNANDSWLSHNGTTGIVAPKPFDFVAGRSSGLAMLPHAGGTASIPDSPSLEPSNLTFSAWVKSVAPGNTKYIANKEGNTSPISWAMYTGAGGGLKFIIFNNAGVFVPLTTAAATPVIQPSRIWDGMWHMATGTYDGSKTRLYLDGVQVQSGATDANGSINYSAPKALHFGDFKVGGGAGFQGEIADVQLYNRALSDSEVMSVYQALSSGPVSWWRADDNANDSTGTNNGVLAGSARYGSGRIGSESQSAFKTAGGSVQVPDSTTLQLTNVAVQAWVRCLSPGNNTYIVSKSCTPASASYALTTGPAGGLEFYVTLGSGVVTSPAAGPALWDGLYHLVDGIYDGTNVRLFVDDVEVGSGTAGSGPIIYNTTQSAGMLLFGDFSDVPAGANFPGYIDEIKIYADTALALQQMPRDVTNNSLPIIVINQPASLGLNPGSNAIFSVTAVSPLFKLNYQWMFNGASIAGATSSTLTLTNIQPNMAGQYSVSISGVGFDSPRGYTNGASGNAFDPGDTGASARIPDDPRFETQNFTVQLWAKSTPPGANHYMLSKSRDAVAFNSSYALYSGTGAPTFLVCLTNATASPPNNAALVTVAGVTNTWDNNWHQLTGTWDGQIQALYVDGVLAKAVTNATPTNINYNSTVNLAKGFLDQDIVIGDAFGIPSSTFHFPGGLDDVKYFDHALVAADVMDSFTNGPSATNGLIGWWRAETNCFDSVGSNYALPVPPSGSVVSSAATLSLLSPTFISTKVSSGIFQSTLSGPTGGSYIIQSSSNLVNWVPITTNTIPFTVSAPVTGGTQIFYRAVQH